MGLYSSIVQFELNFSRYMFRNWYLHTKERRDGDADDRARRGRAQGGTHADGVCEVGVRLREHDVRGAVSWMDGELLGPVSRYLLRPNSHDRHQQQILEYTDVILEYTDGTTRNFTAPRSVGRQPFFTGSNWTKEFTVASHQK